MPALWEVIHKKEVKTKAYPKTDMPNYSVGVIGRKYEVIPFAYHSKQQFMPVKY